MGKLRESLGMAVPWRRHEVVTSWNRCGTRSRPQDPAKLLKKQADPQLSCLGLDTGKDGEVGNFCSCGIWSLSFLAIDSPTVFQPILESQCLPEGKEADGTFMLSVSQ